MTVAAIDVSKRLAPRWLSLQLQAEQVRLVFDAGLHGARLRLAIPLAALGGAVAATDAVRAVQLAAPVAAPGAVARSGVQHGHLLVECHADPDAVLASRLRLALVLHEERVLGLQLSARWVTFDVTEPTRARAERTADELWRLASFLGRQLEEERRKARPDPLWLRSLEGGLQRAAQRLDFWSRYAADVARDGSLIIRPTAHPA